MLEIKVMTVKQFMQTGKSEDDAELKEMYSRISENQKSNRRMDYAVMPLYACDDRIFGGGDCVRILSHRKGYGYTIIDVGDRGSWICGIHSESKNYNDIAFIDGTSEEVYEELLKHF